MQVLLSDNQINNRPRMSKSKAVPPPLLSNNSMSSEETPLQTPSFTPNAPAQFISDADLSLKELEKDAQQAEKAYGLDLDLPVSTLLREGTKRAHVQAENSAGAEALVKGELPLEEYIKWLAVLWRVYDALELALSTHSRNPVLQGIYDPSLLARGPALAADITHLLSLLPPSNSSAPTDSSPPAESTPLPPFPLPAFLSPIFSSPAPALDNFLTHIHHLSTSPGQAPLLLAHAYVRYLGDLSGGQIIGGRIKRAYGLKDKDGIAFYDFSSKGERSGFESDPSMEGGKKRLMDIKDWYRRGMDDGVGEDKDLKERLVAEANLSFALNTSLFALVPPPPAKSSTGTRQVPPALQNVEQLRGQLDGNFGTIPMCLFAFGLSLAVSKYVLPQIYDMLGM